jgi:hypothetical protein
MEKTKEEKRSRHKRAMMKREKSFPLDDLGLKAMKKHDPRIQE